MRNSGLEEAQAGIKIAWRNINNFRYADDTTLRAKGKEELKSFLMKVKSRDITLPTKVHLVKAMVFPVVMYGCESWTIKRAKCQRIDALELLCWRRLLRVHWTAGRSTSPS